MLEGVSTSGHDEIKVQQLRIKSIEGLCLVVAESGLWNQVGEGKPTED